MITYCVNGAVGSFIMALFWSGLTEPAAFFGTLVSAILAVGVWLIYDIMERSNVPLSLRKFNIKFEDK